MSSHIPYSRDTCMYCQTVVKFEESQTNILNMENEGRAFQVWHMTSKKEEAYIYVSTCPECHNIAVSVNFFLI